MKISFVCRVALLLTVSAVVAADAGGEDGGLSGTCLCCGYRDAMRGGTPDSLFVATCLEDSLFFASVTQVVYIASRTPEECGYALEELNGLTEIDLLPGDIEDVRRLERRRDRWDVGVLCFGSSPRSIGIAYRNLPPIAWIAEFPSLRAVDISFCNVSSLDGLSHDSVTSLSLKGNRLSDIGPLPGLPSVEILDISDNPITDLSPLLKMPALRALHVDGLQGADLEIIGQLESLKVLSVQRCSLTNVDFLATCKALEKLYVSHNEIASVRALKGLSNLRTLHLTANPIIDKAELDEFRHVDQLSY